MIAKKDVQLLCICTAGSSPPIHITPHVSREQRYQGGAAIWLSEDAIDHLSWVWCSALYKSQCESDIPASVEKQLCWSSAGQLNHLNGPRQPLFVVFPLPLPRFAAILGGKVSTFCKLGRPVKPQHANVCQYQMCAVSNLCAASSAL